MSMWKLSPEAEQDVKDLYEHMRRPSLLARRTVELIERLASRNEPAAIPAIASGLFSSSKAIHSAASSGVATLMNPLPSLALIRLSEVLGGYYHGYVSERWNGIKPKQVESILAKTKDVPIGNLLSFHRNGYIRHVAIRYLASVNTGEELRFLLIRQNDWVDSISKDARNFVQTKLDDDTYLKHFVEEADLLFHLPRYQRRDLTKIVARFIDLLIQPQHRGLLSRAMNTSSKQAARKLIDELLSLHGDHLREVVRQGVKSSDGVCRVRCIKRAFEVLPHDESIQVADDGMTDGFIPVRHEAYELKAKLLPDSKDEIWESCLLDKSKSLRGTAMFYLKNDGYDVASIYRDKLKKLPNSFAALSGLVESGDCSDLDIFHEYLNSPFASRRSEAIFGIGRVGKESEVIELRRFLLDPSPRVVRETYRQLQQVKDKLDANELLSMLTMAESNVGKQTILRMLFDLGRWNGIGFMIQATASPDEIVKEHARELLSLWFSPTLVNRVFTRPSDKQRNQIQNAINDSIPSADDSFLKLLSYWLSPYQFDCRR